MICASVLLSYDRASNQVQLVLSPVRLLFKNEGVASSEKAEQSDGNDLEGHPGNIGQGCKVSCSLISVIIPTATTLHVLCMNGAGGVACSPVSLL